MSSVSTYSYDRNSFILYSLKQTVNIPHAYDDPRFDSSVDENTSFKHKSILCMAIKNSLGQIIGVIQLINKFDELVSFLFTQSISMSSLIIFLLSLFKFRRSLKMMKIL